MGKISKLEKKLLSWIEKNIDILMVISIILIALVVRYFFTFL